MTVFERIGIPYAADLFNFVILTAVISAANSNLYAAGRMIWALAHDGMLPAWASKRTKRGLPVNAIMLSMLGGWLALFTSVFAADTVFVVLTAIVGFSVVAVWIAISVAHIGFRRQLKAEGKSASDLAWHSPLFPVVPVLAIILCSVAFIGLLFDPEQRLALYFGVPFAAACMILYPVIARRRNARREATRLAEAGRH